MLKRIATYLSISSLMVVSVAPLTTFAAPASGNGNAQRHVEKKTAPEFAGTANVNGTVRVLMQTKGAPTSAHDTALATARGDVADVPSLQHLPGALGNAELPGIPEAERPQPGKHQQHREHGRPGGRGNAAQAVENAHEISPVCGKVPAL